MPVADLIRLGMPRTITRWGSPVLHRKAKQVDDFGPELQRLLADMFATNTAADGAGLAAQQVGVDLAAFVYDCTDADGHRQTGVICNPVIETPEGRGRHLISEAEGCLSLPGAWESLARPNIATCRGLDQYGRPVTIAAGGTLGRCLQHETDHTNGMVFGDRLTKRARKNLHRAYLDGADRYPLDWPVTSAK